MTFNDAHNLRRRIIVEHGIHAVVPCGHGPEGYFVVIYSSRGNDSGKCIPVYFHSSLEWEAWSEWREKDEAEKRLKMRPRSALDIMIDQACGIE